MEVTGTIKAISAIQKYGNDFYKREVVVVVDGQYPQPINIEFMKGKADIIENYAIGDIVTVGINLRGREWTSPQGEVKYFNSIEGWSINKVPLQNASKKEEDEDFIFDQ